MLIFDSTIFFLVQILFLNLICYSFNLEENIEIMAASKYFSKNNKITTKISAIFFDLDNTLIPTRTGDSKACKKLSEILQSNYSFTQDEADKTITTFLKSFRSCPDNPQTSLDSWRSYLWSESLPNNYKHLDNIIYEQWLQLRYRYLAISTEYVQLLKNLRNDYQLALITNGPSNAQWEKIKKLKVKQYFDCVLVSADLPWEKPHPNIFLAACNYLNVKPQECMMIGDKLETDIQGGKDANLSATVWIPLKSDSITNNVQPKPDFIVKNLCEITKFLPKYSNNGGDGNGTSSSSSGSNSSSNYRRNSLHSSSSLSSSSMAFSLNGTGRNFRTTRVSSLPELMDCSSENSSDSCFS